jgi:hypothetical protein
MGIVETLFGKKSIHEEVKKYVVVYLSPNEGKIIVAPCYKDLNGIYYEQEKCALLSFTTKHETLGIEVKNAAALFKIKHADHREAKKPTGLHIKPAN